MSDKKKQTAAVYFFKIKDPLDMKSFPHKGQIFFFFVQVDYFLFMLSSSSAFYLSVEYVLYGLLASMSFGMYLYDYRSVMPS